MITLTTPGGNPASSSSSAIFSVVSGVVAAGLTTIVLPAISAGRELGAQQREREVVGHDRRDDAHRAAQDHAVGLAQRATAAAWCEPRTLVARSA